MPSKPSEPRSTRSTLTELGPALAGIGTLLAGVAAVAALLLSRPASAPNPTGQPTAASSLSGSAIGASSSAVVSMGPSESPEELADFAVRLRAAAASAGVPAEPAEYPRYVVAGPRAGMSAEVPAVWPDRSITLWEDAPPGSPRGTPREALGSILIASADEKSVTAHPGETYEVPLLILSASRRLATEHQPGAILEMRNIEYRLDCEPQASGTVRVGVFTGPYEIYSGCSGAKALLVQAELRPTDGQVVIGLNARLASTADVSALEHGLRSLRIEADGILR